MFQIQLDASEKKGREKSVTRVMNQFRSMVRIIKHEWLNREQKSVERNV